jgi:hypothetical protein
MTDESDMTYEAFERADADYEADTFGLTPGVAAVYMEHMADVFCKTCARDMLGDDLFSQLKEDNLGYDHPKADQYGNVAAVLSTEEWDCPGANCGHCGVPIDVRVIHYDSVCQPEYCPRMATMVADPDGVRDPVEAAILERDDGDARIMLKEDFDSHGDEGDTSWIPESLLRD